MRALNLDDGNYCCIISRIIPNLVNVRVNVKPQTRWVNSTSFCDIKNIFLDWLHRSKWVKTFWRRINAMKETSFFFLTVDVWTGRTSLPLTLMLQHTVEGKRQTVSIARLCHAAWGFEHSKWSAWHIEKLQLLKWSPEVMQLASARHIITCVKSNDSN